MKMNLVVDEHLRATLEFMQASIPEAKLIHIADRIPELARLLWGQFPQEPLSVLTLQLPKPITTGRENQSLSTATE